MVGQGRRVGIGIYYDLLEDRLHDVNLHTTGTYRVRVGDKGR